ncbi:Dynein heavy chain domain-containing protein 1 [Rhizoctonia solani]|uniref:Dynein heavy chain domain-containing protein 1 n=1 Tax=Rhizoctonia solani TaxID=456999 RepID=A0A0K6FZZ8_9AGAM|nr:Dynein heavy chain domain-containing protein 1 [Rhizoctonia solani]
MELEIFSYGKLRRSWLMPKHESLRFSRTLQLLPVTLYYVRFRTGAYALFLAGTYAPRLPAPVPPTPIPVTIGGLNIGQVRSTTDPLPPVAQGVLVNPEFSFVPKAVVDLFIKKNWSSHISLRYLTDEYCQQVDRHDQLRDTMHFDSGSGTWVTSSAELPDLSESSLAFVQWMRAFQRLLAILRSMSHPRTPYWEAHGHIVEHHPSLTSNWPLVLAYDIAMRRRSVLDRSLDVSIFQERVFNDLRPQFERRAMEDFVRGLYATEAARRAPAAETQTARGQLQIAAGPSSAPNRASGPSSQGEPLWCFVCGGSAHTSRTCRATAQVSGKELVTTRSADGKNWVIDAAIEPTSAPSAAAAPTLPALAGLNFIGSDPRVVVTPLLVQPWTVALKHAHALPEFNDLLTGIVEGFRIGVHSSLAATTIYPNHLSARSRPDIILNHIAKEVAAGRYTGPFSPDSLSLLIGHFRASPLGVVDKPSSPGEFHVIQDFSFPRSDLCNLSVNSEINPDDFCCTWGFFQDVVEIILKLPPGAEAATFDVDAAYRRMPVHPSDQNHIVVHWEGQCWIDHCVPFGAASSNGIFGRCGDAMVRVSTSLGFSPVVKWVDNFLYFRVPSRLHPLSFGYAESDILRLGDLLGLPWKAAKTKPFADTFRYLGFDWTISQPRVMIPPEKCAKFTAKISSWLHSGPATLRSTESVLGSLIHCALAVPLGRSRVAGIARFTGSFSHAYKDRFKTRAIPDYAKEDAAWWLDILLQPDCGSSLSLPPPFIDIPCFVDASTSFGVGVHLGGRVRAWVLKKGWKSSGRDIGWAEMIALELALLALAAAGYSNCSIMIHSDNQGVIGAFQTGRSRNTHQNAALQRIQSLVLDRNIQVSLTYVHTDENLADAPSRGIIASTDTHFPSFDLPSHLDKWLRPFATMFHLPIGEHKLQQIRARIAPENSPGPAYQTREPQHTSLTLGPTTLHTKSHRFTSTRTHPYLRPQRPPAKTSSSDGTRPRSAPKCLPVRSPARSASLAEPSSLLNKALQHALALKTLTNYTSAVNRFLSWCNNNRVRARDRLPTAENVLSLYAASFAGTAAGTTAANAMSALKTWHVLNNAPWKGGPQLPLVLRGVSNLAPESSRRPERPGVTRQMLIQLHDHLDPNIPLHASVFAAAAVAFWGQCRLSELLGTSRRNHAPKTHPSRSSLTGTPTRGVSAVLHLPFTKTAGSRGQDIVIPHQLGPADPISALVRHWEVNADTRPGDHLFAFRSSPNGPRHCLTKEVFLKVCNDIWRPLGHPRITGHCFRIGGTNTYMESGVPAEIVKSKGRWESDAFLVYWRNKNRLAAAHTERIPLSDSPRAPRAHASKGDDHSASMRPPRVR